MGQFSDLLFGSGNSRYTPTEEEKKRKKEQPFWNPTYSQAELDQAQQIYYQNQTAQGNKEQIRTSIQKEAEAKTEEKKNQNIWEKIGSWFQGSEQVDLNNVQTQNLQPREDYFSRAGIDINQAFADKRIYDSFIEEHKGQSIIELAKNNQIPEEAKRWEKIKDKVTKIEQDYQRMIKSQAGERNPIQEAEAGFTSGVAGPITKAIPSAGALIGKALDVVAPEGSTISNAGEKLYEGSNKELQKINQRIIDKGFAPGPDSGLIYDIGSGAGSLVSSMAIAGATGATSATAGVFGVTQGAEQVQNAEQAGKDDRQQLITGLVAGLAEAGLEKVGLDRFIKPGSKGLLTKTAERMIVEGTQEASQSLAQSGVSATYSEVYLTDAIKQALYEGGIGAIVGGGGGLAFSVSENLQAQGVEPDVAIETGMNVQDKVQAIIQEENTGPVAVDVKTPETEKYQWLRNKEGGQSTGNQTEVKPITEADFNTYVAPTLQEGYANNLQEYQAKQPEAKYISLTKVDGKVKFDSVGSLEELRPKPENPKWATKVKSFDSPQAIKLAKTADSELKPVKQKEPKSKYPNAIYKEYSDYIQSIEADMTGGQMIPDGEGGYKRTSSHSKFYRETFANQGRKPTKAQWLDYAKQEVDSGRADSTFMDYANAITKENSSSKTSDDFAKPDQPVTTKKRPPRNYRAEALELKTPEEMSKLADLLNKAGQSGAILRKGQLKKKTALGTFTSGAEKKADRLVKLQDAVIKDPKMYPVVLAHELAHAIDYHVNGDTKNTLKMFGDLTKEETNQITEELKKITRDIEGDLAVKKNPQYFYRPTEMFARYIETMILSPGTVDIAAPLTTQKFEELVLKNEVVSNFVDAIAGKIDKGWVNKTPDLFKDLRQVYRKYLGKTAGDAAYDAEVIRRAEVNRATQMIDKLLKTKFKGVKDDPQTLFRAVEGILITENGKPQFGTTARKYLELDPTKVEELEMVRKGMTGENVDKKVVKLAEQIKALEAQGWKFETYKSRNKNNNDELSVVMSRPRYTAQEAKSYFDSLSDKGKQLVVDFTSARQEAKDDFNRELLKDIYGIETDLEGWVHHFFEGKPYSTSTNTGLKRKVASARKQRSEADGFVEDFQKAMRKALAETELTEINNEFITDQLARISKPIAEGQQPDKGWVEVWADEKGGLRLPGEGGVTIIQSENGKSFKKPEKRYQVPIQLADHYRTIRRLPTEVNKVAKIANQVGKYWGINVLTHGGTTSTNYLSGGVQYGMKLLDDFYFDLLSADFGMTKTRKDLAAPVRALLPKNWDNAPTWLYGGYRSTFAGQFASGEDSKIDRGIERYGNNVLKLFGAVETYWKRTIALSEGSNLSDAQKRSMFKRLQADEKKLIAEMNKPIDLFALDYDNTPLWLANFDRKGGKLVKPFMKYPYKYTKMITNHVVAPFDRSLTHQERAAKALALGTMIALIASWYDDEKRKQLTPEGTEKTPYPLRPQGRVRIGQDEVTGDELFVRTAKYPFLNLTSLGESIINRNFSQTTDLLRDQFGTIGPGMELALLAVGRKTEFNQYTPVPAIIGQQVATLIPGFRILNDIGAIVDPYKRTPTNFIQGVTGNLPVWGSEETRAKLRGDRKTLKIPNETDAPREMTPQARTNNERDRKNTWGDVLLSTLTGIYINRINPKEAEAQELRETRDKAEAQIRTFLKDGNEADAKAMADEYGLIIKEGTLDYYKRERNAPKEDGSGVLKNLNIPGFDTSSSSSSSSSNTSDGALNRKRVSTENIKNRTFTVASSTYNWSEEDLRALDTLINNESGWNEVAQNPTSSAWGLFQFLDMHQRQGGYLPNGTNSTVEEQIQGGLRYIKDRYGTPSNALAFWLSNSPHWY